MRSTLFAIALLCAIPAQAEETVFPFAQVADNGTGQPPEPPLMPGVQRPNQTVPPTQEANPQTSPGSATAPIPGQMAQLPIPTQTQQVQPNSFVYANLTFSTTKRIEDKKFHFFTKPKISHVYLATSQCYRTFIKPRWMPCRYCQSPTNQH